MPIHTKRPHPIDTSTTLFTRTIRSLIVGGSSLLGAVFVWLAFRDFDLAGFISDHTTPLLLWRGALSLYYISWIAGTNFDVDVQELAYVEFPERGRVPFHGFITIVTLIGAGFLLGWTIGHLQRFAIAIDIFIIVDHVAWIYLKWLLDPVICNSARTYMEKRDYFSLEQLRVVVYQILGNWKWWRFTGTIPLLIMLHVFAFSNTTQSYIATMAVGILKGADILPQLSDIDARAFLAGMLVLLFVLVAEIWSWALRIRTWMYVKCIDDLFFRYVLEPIDDNALCPSGQKTGWRRYLNYTPLSNIDSARGSKGAGRRRRV